jgi:DNA-binding transcriptional ArsR family regulator
MSATAVNGSANGSSPAAILMPVSGPMTATARGHSDAELAATCDLMLMAASPVRLRALRALNEGDRDLATLAGLCGTDDEAAVAHHLDLLRSAGLVEKRVSEADATAPALYRITGGGRSLVRAAGVAGVKLA